jgi:ribosomal protein L22
MSEEDKKDEVEETTAGETPEETSEETVAETTTEETVEEPVAEAEQAADEAPDAEDEDVSPEAAEDPGVVAPEASEEQVVPDKPKRRTRAKKATEDEAPAEEAKPKRSRAKKETGDEEEAAPARRRRDEPRPVPVGIEVRAQAKYVRTSARKARLVCDHIRGKDVVEARAILAFTPRRAAEAWIKLLESAVANAEHNHELVGEELRIKSVHADEGPTLKRFRPRAMGRATRIRKRTSHLTITLTPKES